MTKLFDLPVAPPRARHLVHIERHLTQDVWLGAIDDVEHHSRLSARLMLVGLEADHTFAGYEWNTPPVFKDRAMAIALGPGAITIVTVTELDELRAN